MSRSAPGRRRDVHVGRLFAGVVLLLLGVGWLLEALDVANVPWDVLLPIALVMIGGLVLWNARAGRGSGGLVALGIVLTVVLAIGTIVSVPLEGGIGDRTYRPRSLASVQKEYRLAIGQLTLDLTKLPNPADQLGGGANVRPLAQAVRVRLGIGNVRVLAPDWMVIAIKGHAGVGQVQLFGRQDSGFSVDLVFSTSRPPNALSLDVSVGIGQVQVTRG